MCVEQPSTNTSVSICTARKIRGLEDKWQANMKSQLTGVFKRKDFCTSAVSKNNIATF